MKKEHKIDIIINKARPDIELYINESFTGRGFNVHNNYIYESNIDLLVHVTFILGDFFISDNAWNLIRGVIGKLFKKYPKIVIAIKDKDDVIFTFKNDLKVKTLSKLENGKRLVKIRNIYDLARYLIKETDKDKIEYRKRFDFVLGVVVAGVFGWLINILSDVYYDVFLKHTVKIESYDSFQLSLSGFILFVAIGFLKFLVYDYKNKLILEKNFWDRFIFFLNDNFNLSFFASLLKNLFIILFLVFFNLFIFNTLNVLIGFVDAVIVSVFDVVFSLVLLFIKQKIKEKL